jgi:hypothetical protein
LGWVTVTLAVVSARPGSALAWIVADPPPTPVIGTVTLFVPDAKVTVAGTVATLVLLELKLITTPPDGAGTDKLSARFCVAVPVIVAVVGEKLSVAVTCTAELPGA